MDVQPPKPQIHQFAVGSFSQQGDHIYLQRFRAPRLSIAFRQGLSNRKWTALILPNSLKSRNKRLNFVHFVNFKLRTEQTKFNI